tara:strand:- start:222 stop:482 length:261 start_codon:yes stop_codon:yes gene_type:complete
MDQNDFVTDKCLSLEGKFSSHHHKLSKNYSFENTDSFSASFSNTDRTTSLYVSSSSALIFMLLKNSDAHSKFELHPLFGNLRPLMM